MSIALSLFQLSHILREYLSLSCPCSIWMREGPSEPCQFQGHPGATWSCLLPELNELSYTMKCFTLPTNILLFHLPVNIWILIWIKSLYNQHTYRCEGLLFNATKTLHQERNERSVLEELFYPQINPLQCLKVNQWVLELCVSLQTALLFRVPQKDL